MLTGRAAKKPPARLVRCRAAFTKSGVRDPRYQMAYPLEHHDVRTNGLRLHVVQCGPPAGELVVLLHGFPEFWYGWQHQIQVLAQAGYRVWVPDQRGYNLSDKPARVADYALPTLAADIIGLLDAAGAAQARVVGHDWGGIVAWYLAAHYPARVLQTAILNVPHPAVVPRQLWRLPSQLLRSWYIFFFQLPGLPEWFMRRRACQAGVRTLVGTSRRGTFAPADLDRYRAAWTQPGALTGMLNWYRALLRRPALGRWPRIRGPLLLLWGRRDAFLDARLAEPSVRECEQGSVEFFDKATHWLQHEEAAAVNARLLVFFKM